MPQSAMLKIADFGGAMTKKGPLQKSTEGEEQFVWVTGFRHETSCVMDPKTGMPVKAGAVGKKPALKHQPFVIQKKIDFTTPKFHEAFRNNLELSPWKLHLYHIPASGGANNYFSISLKKAKICAIEMKKPFMAVMNAGALHEIEEISFTYEEITWESTGAPLGLDWGNAPMDAARIEGPMEPDWIEVQARAQVEKIAGLLYDRVKDGVRAKLIAEGVITEEGLLK